MNRQTIEQAADNYAANATPSYTNGDFDRHAIAEAFEAGIEWRISFVWHTNVKTGSTCKAILVRFNNGLFNVFEDIRDLKGIEDLVAMFAYLDDLIPNGKEDAK